MPHLGLVMPHLGFTGAQVITPGTPHLGQLSRGDARGLPDPPPPGRLCVAHQPADIPGLTHLQRAMVVAWTWRK